MSNSNTDSRQIGEFAIASLTMGIVSFVTLFGAEKPIVAIVFGILALRRIRSSDQVKGKRLAIAGIVLGVIGVILLPLLALKFLPQMIPSL